MDKKLLMQYIVHPELLGGADVDVLKAEVEKYPFFHIGHMLLLKAMHSADDFSYPAQLAHSAVMIPNRTALFELINQVDINEVAYSGTSPVVDATVDTPKDLTQWLEDQRFSSANMDEQTTETLIDRFIQTNPKIKPSENPTSVPDVENYDVPSQAIMTETLARIYVQQKKYDNAIEAYSILMLKNPKKSSFFAQRIEEIKELKKIKN
ncbi:MAG: hypothetical protein PHD21_06240 [Flavobacteriales bacterium]|nr:hypothetical protein [Flavobacteriales bacterium]